MAARRDDFWCRFWRECAPTANQIGPSAFGPKRGRRCENRPVQPASTPPSPPPPSPPPPSARSPRRGGFSRSGAANMRLFVRLLTARHRRKVGLCDERSSRWRTQSLQLDRVSGQACAHLGQSCSRGRGLGSRLAATRATAAQRPERTNKAFDFVAWKGGVACSEAVQTVGARLARCQRVSGQRVARSHATVSVSPIREEFGTVDVIAVLRSVGDTVSRGACDDIYSNGEYIPVTKCIAYKQNHGAGPDLLDVAPPAVLHSSR